MSTGELHDFHARTCIVCDGRIDSMDALMQVPVVDPYGSECFSDLVGLIGEPVHSNCWNNHPLCKKVGMLAVKGLEDDFTMGKSLTNGEIAGAWIRPSVGDEGVGVIFLPRSSYVFDNLLGMDVKGGFIGGSALDIIDVLKVLTAINSSGICAGQYVSETRDRIFIEVEQSKLPGRFLLVLSEFTAGGHNEIIRAYIQMEDLPLLEMRPHKNK